MFNLPCGDSPELLLGEFDFQTCYYEVCFETIEERYGLFNNKIREVNRYYITANRKTTGLKKEVKTLRFHFYKTLENDYMFRVVGQCSGIQTVFWDNPTDPINLLTFLKGRLDENSHEDFVIFSSKDLE